MAEIHHWSSYENSDSNVWVCRTRIGRVVLGDVIYIDHHRKRNINRLPPLTFPSRSNKMNVDGCAAKPRAKKITKSEGHHSRVGERITLWSPCLARVFLRLPDSGQGKSTRAKIINSKVMQSVSVFHRRDSAYQTPHKSRRQQRGQYPSLDCENRAFARGKFSTWFRKAYPAEKKRSAGRCKHSKS